MMKNYDAEGNPIEAKKNKSTIWTKIGGGPLAVAALFHLMLLVVGAFWIFQNIQKPEVDFLPGGGEGGESGMEHQMEKKKRAQITTNVRRIFVPNVQSDFSIPEQSEEFGQKSTLPSISNGGMPGAIGSSGSGPGFKGPGKGPGLSDGVGNEKLFLFIPETMRKRCSKEYRLQRLNENGGNPACEEAVLKSLRWLKSTQASDGSWGVANKPAMTGLALLAYFGHCETPVSEEFGDSCMKGIVYLVDLGSKNGGKMASNFTSQPWCYEHAIATYALGEAATFCKDLKIEVPELMETTEKAGQFIINNQNKNGGWAYQYATEGGHADVSVAGWQIQALKACNHTEIKFKGMSSCINKGLDYLNACQADNGGYGYTGKAPAGDRKYFTLTGVGMLCNQMWGKGSRTEVRKAAKYVLANTKFNYNTADSDLYVHYYESQAMMQRGGDEWKTYNDLFRDQILNNQDADGSWKSPGIGGGFSGSGQGKTYRTCLATLMLEVYYRFLNTGGGGGLNRRPGI